MFKVAGQNDLPVVEGIMQRIFTEDPSYWPYGLNTDQFNGGLYLVQKSASAEPVGFVGWQHFDEGDRRVGYYAIGILPPHREQGFAKQAVAQVIREIGGQCDEVRAMVMSHNKPSKALARSLHIPILEKIASMEKIASTRAQAISSILTGLGSAAFFDQTADPDRTLSSTFQPQNWDKGRALMGALNLLLGGVGGQQLATGKIGPGLGAIALAPTKDLAIKGVGSLYKIDRAADEASQSFSASRKATPATPPKNWVESVPKEAWIGAGGLGLGAIGALVYNAKRNRDLKQQELAQQNKGRVKITLPTKSPGDSETQVDIPFSDLNLSQALTGRLTRDTKRRLHEETKARTRHRKPRDPNNPTEKEKEDMELQREEEELDKEASILSLLDELRPPLRKLAAAAMSIPTPPQLGQNPAMRMNPAQQMMNQKATANSIQPSTDANPQIMEAQNAAAQAEQAAQQQVAQAEQKSQQAVMEQDAAAQQERMKLEQEKEILKLQLEKEKAIADVGKAQAKAQAAAGKGDGTAVQRLTGARISRLQRRLKTKSAAATTPTPGPLNPSTGQTVAKPMLWAKPEAAGRYNQSGGLFTPATDVFRHSYGPVGDWFYDFMIRGAMNKPTAQSPTNFSRVSAINTPDKMGMIEAVYGAANNRYPGVLPQFG